MAIASEGETSYRGGAGGKFQKRPARRHQTTPYDRPPSIVRNPRPGGWVSKLFDPASRFISARAFKFFSNFRKRITEAEQEPKDGPQEVAPNLVDCNEVREQDIAFNGNMSNRSEGNGISDLEQMLQRKTFTRSEIDRLTELLHSRTTESSYRDKEKTSEGDLYKSVSDIEKHKFSTRGPLHENRDDGIRLQNVTATGDSSKVLEEDIASPAELAKAYMGRSSKASPSMLGVRSQSFKEETPLLKHGVYPSKSSALSLVSKSVLRDGAPEKSFATPRSRGRSAIYNMARTPYSRGTGTKNYIYAGPSSSSSPQSVWEHNGQLGSKQLALKRMSSVLDDDIGSVSAIRRIRQKPNLLYNTSPLSARGTDLGHSAGQHHVYPSDKPLLLEDANNKVSKNREESEDDSVAVFKYPLVHSQSRQMASKILQQLEKITPQKSSESKQITARDKSPIKLTSNMLRGQALRSLENADSTKFLQKQECGRLEDSGNALQDAGGETSKTKNVVEENGFKESNSSLKLIPSSAGANSTSSMKNAVPDVKNGESFRKFSAQPPQKKRAFRMTANEDFAELDDEPYTNGFASGEKTEELQIVRKSVSPRATAMEKILTKAEGKIPENLTSSSTIHKLSGGSVAALENTGVKTPAEVAPTSNFQQDINAQSTFSASPSGELAGLVPPSWSSSRRQTSNSFGDHMQLIIRETDKVDFKNSEKLEHVISPSENSTSAAVSVSTASVFVSSTLPSENLSNGLVDSKPFSHSLPPKLSSSTSTEQAFENSSTITHSLTSAAMTSSSTSISSPSIFSVKPPSFPIVAATPPPSFSSEPVASPIFSFGASKTESSPATIVSTVAVPGTAEMKSNEETPISNSNKPPLGGAFATTNAGNNPFGFSNSFAASSSTNNQSQVALPSFGSSSTVSSQLLPPTTGTSTVTQSAPFQFGSSGSSTIFGTSGSSFTANVSVMGSSVPPTNPFASGTTSLSGTSFPFSSVSPTNPFGSSASSPSPSPLFSFGASQTTSSTSSIPSMFGQSTGTTSVSTFSFTSPTATTSPMPSLPLSKPVFGSATAPKSPGNSGDQMNMEDSMAEDPAHSSNPTGPVFGQPSSSNPAVPVFGQSSNPAVPVFGQSPNPAVPVFGQSNPTMPTFGQPLVSQSLPTFTFGSAAPPSIAASPFQFGGQQNQATPQNLPSFQTSNSLVNSGGSFSLGSSGGDKGNRKMVRISKNKNRRK
ncbi:nuclear pore complex protein NUP1 isoform X1 [Apium graveolens]|uniref:nuclear pore complex protein NUP1 isoform X1 n=1 Tax=Apium graveolens TaxID=4045 RepID=UPI003D791F63